MKPIYLFFILLIAFIQSAYAQTPQIALERPSNNTTQIFTTLQAAYAAAINDDVIYLPGGIFGLNGDSIAKKIHIIGAGLNFDSTVVTGKTVIYLGNYLTFKPTSLGASIEGIEINSINISGGIINGAQQINIKNCKMNTLQNGNGNNSIIKNCIIPSGISGCSNSLVENCIIGNSGYACITGCSYSTIQNCIFTAPTNGCDILSGVNNCTFRNNIFPTNCTNSPTSVFQNNLKYNPYTPSGNEYNTILVDSIPQIFMTNMNTIGIDLSYNYELKPTCPGNNAGTDGTDIGIYGGAFPCPKGWVPSNPHMYFKQVASQTTPDGKLQIHYKVRKGE
ncbi:MAG: right-handed parallel beta-helix repeat-containing protein [Bacteroidetes bacterium]|nr:right-handed parallel beta-helix repeat-containing protein [Bacteroidota bacterium]MBK9300678.1 right-handed parallel beta-helix repeat-containing protein [Bacteroidota bacterium]